MSGTHIAYGDSCLRDVWYSHSECYSPRPAYALATQRPSTVLHGPSRIRHTLYRIHSPYRVPDTKLAVLTSAVSGTRIAVSGIPVPDAARNNDLLSVCGGELR
eukprot:3451114-Rhodomonas_salina.3